MKHVLTTLPSGAALQVDPPRHLSMRCYFKLTNLGHTVLRVQTADPAYVLSLQNVVRTTKAARLQGCRQTDRAAFRLTVLHPMTIVATIVAAINYGL